MIGDRERWNQKWRERGDLQPPSAFLIAQASRLPDRGRALDVGGGTGRHAVWLAERGLDVTLVDVSDVALERATDRAVSAGVRIHVVRLDLDAVDDAGAGEPLDRGGDDWPPGPWDVIVVHHCLCRARWSALAAALAPGAVLVMCQPTMQNLQRHVSPGARFLVEPGELAGFAARAGLAVEHDLEDWTRDGRHVAELVARRG